MIPTWAQAGLWGLLAGSALVLGALAGFYLRIPRKVVAAVMAFGSGVLISALSFELMDEAHERGGFVATAVGFLVGALIYTGANAWLARRGAAERKEPGTEQPSEEEEPGSGLALAIGALVDGIPEALVIGLSLLAQSTVSLIAVAAVFLSNVPEGLASASGMKKAGRSAAYVFGVWGGIALANGLAAVAGYTLFQGAPSGVVAATTAVAAGAILTMLVDTMIPEAFEVTRNYAGLLAVLGFLAAFALSKLG